MPNQKRIYYGSLQIAGYKHNLRSYETAMCLYDDTNQNGAADSATRPSSSYSAYQVPSENSWVCLGIRIHVNAFGIGNLKVYAGDTENALTTLKLTLNIPAVLGTYEYLTPFGIAGGQYLVIDPSNAGVDFVDFIGYQRDGSSGAFSLPT